MLKLNTIWKFYDEEAVLKDITFDFKKGSIYLVSGENGAGKTSLLSVLAGYGNYQEGSIEIESNELIVPELPLHSDSNTNPPKSKNLGFEKIKSQDVSPLYPLGGCYDHLTIVENLNLSLPLCPKAKKAQVITEVLTCFGLETYKDKRYLYLSKGYQQRTSLAVAFINRPEWIVLDEPTVYLDNEGVELLIDAIKLYFKHSSSFIISSHDGDFLSQLNFTELRLLRGEVME